MRKLAILSAAILLTASGITLGDNPFENANADLNFSAADTASGQATLPMAITSATVTFDPKKKDKFVLKGTTGSLSLVGAQSVIFEAGAFKQEITLDKFTKSKEKYTYKAATGDAGIANLVLDMPKGQFSATIQNIFLTGFTNPLPISLKAGTISECSMVLFLVSKNKWTFSGSSNSQYACLITQVPKATPLGLFVNTPKSITVQAQVPPNKDLKTDTVQLFQADDSLNPLGNPLCTLLDNGNSVNGDQTAADNVYSCIVTFQESSPGKVNLMVGAQLAGKITYSPSFSLQVVTPYTQEQAQQTLTAHENAGQTWQANLTKYGDTKKARDETVKTVKKLEGVKDAGVSIDGVNIWIEFKSGIRGGMILDEEAEGHRSQTASPSFAGSSKRTMQPKSEIAPSAPQGPCNQVSDMAEGTSQAIGCNVMIWDVFGDINSSVNSPLYEIFRSPNSHFVLSSRLGDGCDVESLRNITSYGTVVIQTGGHTVKKSPIYATGEFLTLLTLQDEKYMLDLLTGSLEGHLTLGGMKYFFTPTFISTLESNFKNSIVYFESNLSSDLAASFLAKNVHTFFSFSGESDDNWKTDTGKQLLTSMVKDGKDTGEAYTDLPKRNEGNSYFLKYSNSTTEIGYKAEGCYLLEWVDTDFPPSVYLPPQQVHSIDKYSDHNVLHYKVETGGRMQDLFIDISSFTGEAADKEWKKQADGLRNLASQPGGELLKDDDYYVVPGYKSTNKDKDGKVIPDRYSPGTWALKFHKGNIIQVMSFRCYVEYDGNRYDTNCADSRIPGLTKDQLLARYDHEVQIAIGIIDAKCKQNGCID